MQERFFPKEERSEPVADLPDEERFNGYNLLRKKVTLRGGKQVDVHFFAPPDHLKGGTRLGELQVVETPRNGKLPSDERQTEILRQTAGDTPLEVYTNLLRTARAAQDSHTQADLVSTAMYFAASRVDRGIFTTEEVVDIFKELFPPEIGEGE
jgi:hypothetical protein